MDMFVEKKIGIGFNLGCNGFICFVGVVGQIVGFDNGQWVMQGDDFEGLGQSSQF